MPAVFINDTATTKISTRPSVGLVRYRLESLPLKIASAMLPPNGKARVMPATTVTVSINACADGCSTGSAALPMGAGALGIRLGGLVKEQLRATAASHA